jgi:hypothetical protein
MPKDHQFRPKLLLRITLMRASSIWEESMEGRSKEPIDLKKHKA